MTCHGMEFPYAMFYCHAVNPTRVYEVTLARIAAEDDGADSAAPASPSTMRALAVCHLDTSRFSPENPFFVARRLLKPGDAAVCHFTGRGGVVWAPAAALTLDSTGGWTGRGPVEAAAYVWTTRAVAVRADCRVRVRALCRQFKEPSGSVTSLLIVYRKNKM